MVDYSNESFSGVSISMSDDDKYLITYTYFKPGKKNRDNEWDDRTEVADSAEGAMEKAKEILQDQLNLLEKQKKK